MAGGNSAMLLFHSWICGLLVSFTKSISEHLYVQSFKELHPGYFKLSREYALALVFLIKIEWFYVTI